MYLHNHNNNSSYYEIQIKVIMLMGAGLPVLPVFRSLHMTAGLLISAHDSLSEVQKHSNPEAHFLKL